MAIINVNFQIRWEPPVYVRIGYGPPEKVSGPEEALDYLKHRWPERQSASYNEAKRCCLAAVLDRGSVLWARKAFLDAAATAKMLA